MTEDVLRELHQDLLERAGRHRYTQKAFRMLPELSKPRILDVGCGTGVPTLEIARLSGGEVIGIDVNQDSLDKLSDEAGKAGLAQRVKAVNCSLFEMPFPPHSFDILWAEGAMWIIGFEKGLQEWRRFIRPRGFMVIHDVAWLRPDPPEKISEYWRRTCPEIMTADQKLEMIRECGYDIIGSFELPEDAWWDDYYGPLEKRIQSFSVKYADNPETLSVLDKEQREVEWFKKSRKWYGSAFFVMQRMA